MNPLDVADAAPPVWERQVGDLQEQARRAYLAQDVNEFGRLLSDDFIVNSPIGRVLTKAEVMELLERGVIRHYTYDEQVELMTRRGDMVVVMGHDIVTMATDGSPIRRRFTNVWCESSGSWLLVARHAQPLAES